MTAARLARIAGFTLVLLMAAASARAANCRITTVPSIAFGPYDVFDKNPVTTWGTLSWSCNKDTTVRITLGPSVNGSLVPRNMLGGIGGADILPYNLYLDATFSIVWGDDSNGTQSYLVTGTSGSPRVYGRIPAGQDVSAGPYTDTVVITVDY